MQNVTQNETTAVSAQTPALPTVYMCTVDGCDQPAASTYGWDWGETGYACHKHQVLLRQKSEALQRTVSFGPLATGPVPMTRDERVALHAARLAVEDELQEAKGRTSVLWDQNQALAAEVRKLTLKVRDYEEVLAALQARHAELERLYEERIAVLADARDELQRLKTLNDALQGASSVDGSERPE